MYKETLIKLLGLEATATDEVISNTAQTFQADMVAFKDALEAENTTLKNSAAEAAEKISNAEAAATKLATEGKAMAEELANYDLEKYKGVIVNAETMKAQLLSNRAGTIAILSNMKVGGPAPKTVTAPLHDPKKTEQPAPVTGKLNNSAISDEDAKRISNRARELMKLSNVSHQQAFMMAKGEQAKPSA